MHLEPKTIIGSTECPYCNSDTPLKVNAKGEVYFHCMKSVAVDEEGKTIKQCRTGVKFGKDQSNRMIEEFLKEKKQNVQIEDREDNSRRDDRADTGEPEQQPEPRRGIGEAVENFFSW